MKTIPPPQKPEVKSAQQAPKPHRAPSRSTYNCTATYLPTYQTFFSEEWQTFLQKRKIKIKENSPNTTSQDQALPTVISTYILRQPPAQIQPSAAPASTKNTASCLTAQSHPALPMSMCVWDLPWTYVLPSKTTIRRSERRKSKSWPSQLASKKVAKKADGAKIEYIFKIHR